MPKESRPILDADYEAIMARQSLREYVLEVDSTNMLAGLTEEGSEERLKRCFNKPANTSEPADELMDRVLIKYHKIQTAFVKRVRERSKEIRRLLETWPAGRA